MSYFLITPFKNVKAQMELNRLGSDRHIVIWQDILCMPNWMNKISRQPSQDPARQLKHIRSPMPAPGPGGMSQPNNEEGPLGLSEPDDCETIHSRWTIYVSHHFPVSLVV